VGEKKKQTIPDAHLHQFHEISIQNSTGLKRMQMSRLHDTVYTLNRHLVKCTV